MFGWTALSGRAPHNKAWLFFFTVAVLFSFVLKFLT